MAPKKGQKLSSPVDGDQESIIVKRISISPPNMRTMSVEIEGTSPLVMNNFNNRPKQGLMDKQAEGGPARNKKNRSPKDFERAYEEAKHISKDGWAGIPVMAIKGAMIDACRLAGVVMTATKLAVFVEEDGWDKDLPWTGLVKITKGEPRMFVEHVRNASGVADLRARPMWDPGWHAVVKIRFDADQLTEDDIVNLLMRAGAQVGILEGRASSKKSNGQNWGFFSIAK